MDVAEGVLVIAEGEMLLSDSCLDATGTSGVGRVDGGKMQPELDVIARTVLQLSVNCS